MLKAFHQMSMLGFGSRQAVSLRGKTKQTERVSGPTLSVSAAAMLAKRAPTFVVCLNGSRR